MPNRARQIIPFPQTPVKTKAKPSTRHQAKTKTTRRRWPVILVCTLLSAYLVCLGIQWVRQELRLRALVAQYEELLGRQQELQAEKELLQQQIDRLLEDPVYLEQLAREMGMVKPGDTIYVPSDPTP